MEIRGSMMSVREDIRILDATLRDGGLVNNFEFTDEFVKALYEMNVAAGVDYMEMGYRASKRQFNEAEFGKWKFATDDDIYSIVGDNDTDLKLAIMADVGRCDYKTDIVDKANLKNPKYKLNPVLELMEKYMVEMQENYTWGYDVPYLLTGLSMQHPRNAIAAVKEHNTHYAEFYRMLHEDD